MTQIVGTVSDASGITSVTVNGEPANGTLDWSVNITVTATDCEGLTTTAAQSQSAAVRATTLLTSVDGKVTSLDALMLRQAAADGTEL